MNTTLFKTINWRNFLFFASTFLVAVIGVPIYIYGCGVSASELMLFGFWATATGMAITVGYHRLFAHRTFKTNPVIVFLSLFFGAAAFEESALQWASQHRDHHKYVDTERDPYNIKQGFFYAHIGWILFRNHTIDYSNVKDLQASKLVMHQNRHYVLWAVTAGVLLPALTGLLSGHLLGALLISVVGRITFVHHGTFFINSVCHYFGKPTYDIHVSAKDHWLVAFLTNGEGYHSFHHRFPSDYRNGHKWYHWDPSKWLISLLARLGFAADLKRVSNFHILAARLAAEKEAVEYHLSKEFHPIRNAALETLKGRYEQLKHALQTWEAYVKEHALLCGQLSNQSDALLKSALERVQTARQQFLSMRGQWSRAVQQYLPSFSLPAAIS
ncbi:MAG: fatty acid desaturase [Candidatus Omnitrophica bacterium]|nr:fatty acid desaturase [Candidatus Omnitrophota bacterium]